MRPHTYPEDYLKKVTAYSTEQLLRFMHDGMQQRGISPEREEEEKATFFTSETKPQISVLDYMKRLTRSLEMDAVGILSAYIYLMRYLEASEIKLTDFNIHRIVATVFVITQKYLYDSYFNIRGCMSITCLALFELTRLEPLFYEGINWELYINPETLRTLTAHFDHYLESECNPQNAPYRILSLELPFDLHNTRDKTVTFESVNVREIHRSVINTQQYTVFAGWAKKEPTVEQTHAAAEPPTATTVFSTP